MKLMKKLKINGNIKNEEVEKKEFREELKSLMVLKDIKFKKL